MIDPSSKRPLSAMSRNAQRMDRSEGRAFPSHGRGRRFNPYSAHRRLGDLLSRPYRRTPLDWYGLHETDWRRCWNHTLQTKACRLQKAPIFTLRTFAAAEICEHQKIEHLGK